MLPMVKARGNYVKDADKWDVNMSSIYSELIREAGKVCEHYASDVLFSIGTIRSWMSMLNECEGKPVVKRELFGFRDMGVDHDTFIECRLANSSVSETYAAIYMVQAVFNDGDVSVGLYDVTEDLRSIEKNGGKLNEVLQNY